jgi:hypothetical protein
MWFVLPAKAFLRSGGRLCVRVELMLRSWDDTSAASFCGACGKVWANMQRGSQVHLENYSCSNTNGNLHDKHEEKGLEVQGFNFRSVTGRCKHT